MAIDLRPEARTALSGLLDKLTYLTLTLGLVSVVVGLFRITSQGWHANVITDVLFFLPMVAVLLARKHIPLELVLSVLVGLATMSAIASFLTLGLGTMSFVGLTACCMVVGVVFGMRSGFGYLAFCVLVVGTVGYAICTGLLSGLLVTDPFLFQPQTWLTQIAGFTVYTVVILVVGGTLQTRLSTTLDAVSTQTEELRESEARYRLLADNMRDVLFAVDLDFKPVYASPSVEHLFGYTPEEFVELDIEDLIPDRDAGEVRRVFVEALNQAVAGDVDAPPESSSMSARMGRPSGAR